MEWILVVVILRRGSQHEPSYGIRIKPLNCVPGRREPQARGDLERSGGLIRDRAPAMTLQTLGNDRNPS
jgi:hypothetical protein